MKNKKKQAQSLVPVGRLFFRSGLYGRFLFFLIRQVERDMHRLVEIRIRLLVIFWQIVQFLEQRFTFTLEAIVDTRQAGCIVFVVLFFTLSVVQRNDIPLIFQGIESGNILQDVLELRIFRAFT